MIFAGSQTSSKQSWESFSRHCETALYLPALKWEVEVPVWRWGEESRDGAANQHKTEVGEAAGPTAEIFSTIERASCQDSTMPSSYEEKSNSIV